MDNIENLGLADLEALQGQLRSAIVGAAMAIEERNAAGQKADLILTRLVEAAAVLRLVQQRIAKLVGF